MDINVVNISHQVNYTPLPDEIEKALRSDKLIYGLEDLLMAINNFFIYFI